MAESAVAKQEVSVMDVTPSEGERTFALAQRQAKALSVSSLVPKAYQGNVSDCMIAMQLANRIGSDPLMVMQNLDIIHGRPSWRATFIIACVNQCGRFSPIRYHLEGEGMQRSCYAWALDRETGDRLEGPPVSMKMAKDEGWSEKAGSKWKTLPELMLRYRAATFFGRLYAPDLLMGFATDDEAIDIEGVDVSRSERPAAAAANAALEALAGGEVVNTVTGEVTGPEVDPDTGEEIPDHVGREPKQGEFV